MNPDKKQPPPQSPLGKIGYICGDALLRISSKNRENRELPEPNWGYPSISGWSCVYSIQLRSYTPVAN